jgi:hypothetical protein
MIGADRGQVAEEREEMTGDRRKRIVGNFTIYALPQARQLLARSSLGGSDERALSNVC